MVRTIEYRSFGGPEVLEMVEVPESAPGPGQVRIAVRAAGLNPVDWKIFSGMMGGDAPAAPQGVGRDYAGVVDAVGEGVLGEFTFRGEPWDPRVGSDPLSAEVAAQQDAERVVAAVGGPAVGGRDGGPGAAAQAI